MQIIRPLKPPPRRRSRGYLACCGSSTTITFARSCKTDDVTLFWVYTSWVGNYPAFFSAFGPDGNFYCLYFKAGDPTHDLSEGLALWGMPREPTSFDPWFTQSYVHCSDCGYVQMRKCSDGSDLPYWLDFLSASSLPAIFYIGGYCASFNLDDTPSDYSSGWIIESVALIIPSLARAESDCVTCNEGYPTQPCTSPTALKVTIQSAPAAHYGDYTNSRDGFGGSVALVTNPGVVVGPTFILPRLDFTTDTGSFGFIDFDAALILDLYSGTSTGSPGSVEGAQTVGAYFGVTASMTGSGMTLGIGIVDPGTGSYFSTGAAGMPSAAGTINSPSIVSLALESSPGVDWMLAGGNVMVVPICTIITVGDSGYGYGTDTEIDLDNSAHDFSIQFVADGEWYFQARDQGGVDGLTFSVSCNRNTSSTWLHQTSGGSSGGPGTITLGFHMDANTTGSGRRLLWNVLNIGGEVDQDA